MMQDILRRLCGLFRSGTMEGGDQTKASIKFGEITYPDIPRLELYGITSVPKQGQKACVYMPAGDANNAQVFAVSGDAPELGSPGDVCIYNTAGHKVTLTDAGISVEASRLALKAGNSELLALISDLLSELAQLPAAIQTGTSSTGPLSFPQLLSLTLDVKLQAIKAKLDAMRLP